MSVHSANTGALITRIEGVDQTPDPMGDIAAASMSHDGKFVALSILRSEDTHVYNVNTTELVATITIDDVRSHLKNTFGLAIDRRNEVGGTVQAVFVGEDVMMGIAISCCGSRPILAGFDLNSQTLEGGWIGDQYFYLAELERVFNFTADRALAGFSTPNGALRLLIDLSNGSEQVRIEEQPWVPASMSPDTRQYALVRQAGLHIHNTRDGSLVRSMPPIHPGVAVMSPDGEIMGELMIFPASLWSDLPVGAELVRAAMRELGEAESELIRKQQLDH